MAEKKEGMSTGTLYTIVLGGCGIAIVGAIVGMKFLSKPPPAAPPPPPAELPTPTVPIRYTPEYYKTIVDKDFATIKAPPIDLAALGKPLIYANELPEPRHLKASGESLDTPHLKLRTVIIKEWATTETGQGFRSEHVALDITNKSAVPLAYRVATEIEGAIKCKSKAAVQHNALVIKAGETIRRTECLFRTGSSVQLKSVEVVELNSLGQYYINRLNPAPPFYDTRTYVGHVVDKEIKPCQFIPWRDIEAESQKGATWSDVIDFYARHNCSEYTWFTGYRRWQAAGELPAKPQ